MKPTSLYLVRHGQVEGFEEKRYNGQGDVPLTPAGQAQFGVLQMRLKSKDIQAVYTSDLSRCLEGARILGEPFSLEPVAIPELRELDIGAWEGHTWEELKRRNPKEWQARLADIVNYQVPGGESLGGMAERVRSALQKIVERHPGEAILLVAHGGVNRVILLDAIGAPLERLFHVEQDYGCLNLIDYYPDGRAVVKLVNG